MHVRKHTYIHSHINTGLYTYTLEYSYLDTYVLRGNINAQRTNNEKINNIDRKHYKKRKDNKPIFKPSKMDDESEERYQQFLYVMNPFLAKHHDGLTGLRRNVYETNRS